MTSDYCVNDRGNFYFIYPTYINSTTHFLFYKAQLLGATFEFQPLLFIPYVQLSNQVWFFVSKLLLVSFFPPPLPLSSLSFDALVLKILIIDFDNSCQVSPPKIPLYLCHYLTTQSIMPSYYLSENFLTSVIWGLL